MEGYSGTPLVKKLGIKRGFQICLIGEPTDYFNLLDDMPPNILWHKNFEGSGLDMVHVFVIGRILLCDALMRAKTMIKKKGSVWVSWPKSTSGLPTDLNDTIVRTIALETGLVDIKVCAIDNVWSGLKLVYRVKDR